MKQSLKDFVGVNSVYEKPDGTKMSHSEVYQTVVNAIGLARCTAYLPADRVTLKQKLAEDKHLNNIPLKKWDYAKELGFGRELQRIGISIFSLADIVCTLKESARMLVKQEAEVLV
jgi:hypothetical protein